MPPGAKKHAARAPRFSPAGLSALFVLKNNPQNFIFCF
jgi:hypothetical protein